MRYLLPLLLLCFLPACSALEKWVTEKATAAAEKKVDSLILDAAPESHATLDADQSGDVTFKEINSYGIPAALALLAVELLRRRLKGKVGELHERINEVGSK